MTTQEIIEELAISHQKYNEWLQQGSVLEQQQHTLILMLQHERESTER